MNKIDKYLVKRFSLSEREHKCFLAGCWFTFFLFLMLESCIGQTITPTIDRNIVSNQSTYSLTAGSDQLQGGILFRDQKGSLKPGLRAEVTLPVNEVLSILIRTDLTLYKGAKNFLEPSSGLSLEVSRVRLTAMYILQEYNGVKNVVDGVSFGVGYRLRFNN